MRFVGANGRFMTCFLIGMSCATGATMATLAWAPATLMRGYGLSTADAGLRLGLVTMVAFPSGLLLGAWIAARLDRRGVGGAEMLVSSIGMALTVPAALALGIVQGVTPLLISLALLIVVTNIPFGIAAAALQSITPNEMRGRMTAIYLFTVNLFGMTLGPLLPALWTDVVLAGDGGRVAESISISVAALAVCAALSLGAGSRLSARMATDR